MVLVSSGRWTCISITFYRGRACFKFWRKYNNWTGLVFRAGQYSLLMVDVAIYWQLFRLYYSFSGKAAVPQDQLLLFGFWHPYHYAHVALWNEFRHTFLVPIFFALFPEEKLKRRRSLTQSSTLLVWPRLAYPEISALLGEQLEVMRQKMLDFDLEFISNISEKKGDGLPENPYRSRFIHLEILFCMRKQRDMFKRCSTSCCFSPVAKVKVS